MDWKNLADQFNPMLSTMVVPLLITAVAWFAQGWSLSRPKEKEDVGRALVTGSFWLGGVAIAIFLLVFIFN